MSGGGFLSDEQGNRSWGRVLMGIHVGLNWIWIHKLLSGAWTVPGDSAVLQIVMGTLDVAILIALGAWVAGPRNIQYMAPLFSALGGVAGGVAGRVASWGSGGGYSVGGPSAGYSRPDDLTLDADPEFSEEDEP